MTIHRRRALLLTLLLLTSIIVAAGMCLRAERRQYALDRQLIAALVKNDAQKAMVLVNSGADPNTPYDPQPAPSLRQLWNYLIRRTPLPTTDSRTALLIACGEEDSDGDEVYMIMNGPENPKLVEAMIEHSGKINMRDQKKWTPLMTAARAIYPKTISVLLAHRASVNAQDAYGNTALSIVIEHTIPKDLAPTDPIRTGIIRQLLAYGADPNQPDRKGNTPLQLAQQTGRSELVALLRQHGAKK